MKKVEVKVDETVMDKICKAVEFATLPVFIALCILSFGFALTLAGFAGLFVSGCKLLKSFMKHNKDIKK